MVDMNKVDPAGAGLDEGRLDRIRQHLESRYLEPGKIAGAQVAVLRNGVLGYAANLGMADRERNRAVADDTIWRLYSMTKPITGVALMTLYEEGHFQLDDPVHRWIPEWRNMTVRHGDDVVPADRPPSVRDIMTHTSGIGYGLENADLDLENAAFRKELTLETLAQSLGEWPLRFQPGTQWLYSFGMDVCARLVEVMSGLDYDAFLRQRIFEPLGMVDTDFWVPEDKLDRLAANYARNARKELVLFDDPETSSYRRKPKLLNGGGGLAGTMPDYLRFVAMLAGGGALDGRRILSRPTLELMTTNHLPDDGSLADMALPGGYGETGFDGAGFGLTMSVQQNRNRAGVASNEGTFMWGGAASTTFWVDPTEDLAVVFMTQLMPSGTFNFGGQLRSLVYGAIDD